MMKSSRASPSREGEPTSASTTACLRSPIRGLSCGEEEQGQERLQQAQAPPERRLSPHMESVLKDDAIQDKGERARMESKDKFEVQIHEAKCKAVMHCDTVEIVTLERIYCYLY